MTRHLPGQYLVRAALMGTILAASAAAAEKPLAAHLPKTQPGDFIRRCGPAGIRKARLGESLVRERSVQWRPKLGMLMLDTTLTNTSRSAAKHLPSVTLADLTFARSDTADPPIHYAQLQYSPSSWYGSTFWTGPDWTRVGKNWQHPGINTPSARCFVAPQAGRVTITGRVYKMDSTKGDGIRASILYGPGRKVLWQAEIGGTDAKGVTHNVTLDVRKGEAIRFVVHKRGQISYDTTGWDPVITYAGGATFQASKGFLTKRLIRMLRKGHNKVKLSPDELRRLAAWIDLNAIFYGVYPPEDQARQLRGECLPMPEIQ